jgi:hypothetical protein
MNIFEFIDKTFYEILYPRLSKFLHIYWKIKGIMV